MIRLAFDTSPLQTGHSSRGIGGYTRYLTAALAKLKDIELVELAKGQRPDLIHYPFFDLYFPTLPFFTRAKKVITIHDMIPLEFPEYYRSGLRGKLAFWRQRLALSTVSAIITVSQFSKEQIVSHLGISSTRVFVVPNAPNPELAPQSSAVVAQVRHQYHLPEQYILYVGDINYNKNIPQLIKALKYLPDDIHLVLLGKNFTPQDIPEWSWIESQLAMSNVTERVQFVTDVPADRPDLLSAFYSGALVYIQPSLSEGFGLPVLEALRCHCPVISSNRGSLPEVGDASVLYAEPTAESFADHVVEVTEWSGRERKRRIEAGDEWQASFSWEHAAEETALVYRYVLEK